MKTKLVCLQLLAFCIGFASAQTPGPHRASSIGYVNAIFRNNQVQVSWMAPAATQTTIIEKSQNGIDFYYAAAFANSNESAFFYADKNFYTGNNYYRIKSYLKNNSVVVSEQVVVNTSGNMQDVLLLPGQMEQKIYLWVPGGTAIARAAITDVAGRPLQQIAPAAPINNLTAIHTQSLATGTYQLLLATTSGKTLTFRFTKTS
jgi:hypothetical protein